MLAQVGATYLNQIAVQAQTDSDVLQIVIEAVDDHLMAWEAMWTSTENLNAQKQEDAASVRLAEKDRTLANL